MTFLTATFSRPLRRLSGDLSRDGVIWISQALREFDLLTAKRQTILTFLAITSLSLPALITIIAPVALFIATSTHSTS